MRLGLGLHITGLRAGGAAAFSPADLFASGEEGVWYEPSPSTCFTDTGGTTAASVGDPVARINDLSGNGNHATQATLSDRPHLRQTGGGLYYLEFDGTDDLLVLPDIPFDSNTGFNAFMAADTTNLGTLFRVAFSRASSASADTPLPLFGGDSGADRKPMIYDQQTGTSGSDFFRAPAASAVQRNAIFAWQCSLTDTAQRTAVVRVDQVETTEDYVEDNKATSEVFNALGASSTNVQNSRINLFGAILRCAAPLSSADIISTEEYLANLSGVTL